MAVTVLRPPLKPKDGDRRAKAAVSFGCNPASQRAMTRPSVAFQYRHGRTPTGSRTPCLGGSPRSPPADSRFLFKVWPRVFRWARPRIPGARTHDLRSRCGPAASSSAALPSPDRRRPAAVGRFRLTTAARPSGENARPPPRPRSAAAAMRTSGRRFPGDRREGKDVEHLVAAPLQTRVRPSGENASRRRLPAEIDSRWCAGLRSSTIRIFVPAVSGMKHRRVRPERSIARFTGKISQLDLRSGRWISCCSWRSVEPFEAERRAKRPHHGAAPTGPAAENHREGDDSSLDCTPLSCRHFCAFQASGNWLEPGAAACCHSAAP